MTIVYEATTRDGRRDCSTAAEAREVVELARSGSITRFHRHPNGHGGFKDSSGALWVYEDRVWYGIDISSGGGARSPAFPHEPGEDVDELSYINEEKARGLGLPPLGLINSREF